MTTIEAAADGLRDIREVLTSGTTKVSYREQVLDHAHTIAAGRPDVLRRLAAVENGGDDLALIDAALAEAKEVPA